MEKKNYLQEETNGIESKFEIFDYNNLGQVRIFIDENRNKWFCHKDVCDILGISDPHVAMRRLSLDGGCSIPVIDNLGRTQQATFINEGNLFRLITSSRKKEAKDFTDWVCDVVLPSLNSKGYYIMDNKPKEEVIEELQKTVSNQENKINLLEAKMENIDSGIERLEDIEHITNRSYMKISTYARYRHLGINLAMAMYLGKMATKQSMELDIPVFSEPHEEYGSIRVYRADVLKSVFDTFYSDADILYGECDY